MHIWRVGMYLMFVVAISSCQTGHALLNLHAGALTLLTQIVLSHQMAFGGHTYDINQNLLSHTHNNQERPFADVFYVGIYKNDPMAVVMNKRNEVVMSLPSDLFKMSNSIEKLPAAGIPASLADIIQLHGLNAFGYRGSSNPSSPNELQKKSGGIDVKTQSNPNIMPLVSDKTTSANGLSAKHFPVAMDRPTSVSKQNEGNGNQPFPSRDLKVTIESTAAALLKAAREGSINRKGPSIIDPRFKKSTPTSSTEENRKTYSKPPASKSNSLGYQSSASRLKTEGKINNLRTHQNSESQISKLLWHHGDIGHKVIYQQPDQTNQATSPSNDSQKLINRSDAITTLLPLSSIAKEANLTNTRSVSKTDSNFQVDNKNEFRGRALNKISDKTVSEITKDVTPNVNTLVKDTLISTDALVVKGGINRNLLHELVLAQVLPSLDKTIAGEIAKVLPTSDKIITGRNVHVSNVSSKKPITIPRKLEIKTTTAVTEGPEVELPEVELGEELPGSHSGNTTKTASSASLKGNMFSRQK